MDVSENPSGAKSRAIYSWRLWLLDTALVTAGLLFFLAAHYGTYEFFGKACAMALLPLIPLLVLVGGAGSTVFALTKVLIERRGLKAAAELALLVGPAVLVALGLGLLGACKSPNHRLAFVCLGNAPASAREVQVAGYSTFLRSEWLAVFRVDQQGFESMVAGAKLVPADDFELQQRLERSALKQSRLYKNFPRLNVLPCVKRVFREAEEHQRGGVYAAFDPAMATALVFREYHD